MKNLTLLTGLAFVAVLGFFNLHASEVSQRDSVPSDGIPYLWDVKMGVKDYANLEGTVGAWSWDEDSFPDTAKGWTHTSNWIAFELTEEARLTLTLQRKANVDTGSGPGLFNLFPAFSIYRGWQETGSQAHNFNNRGDIEWASEVAYYTHVENDGSHSVSGTFRLPAGKYSIVMGGNSPSTDAEGRQGYGATLSTSFPVDASEIKIKGGSRFLTSRRSHMLRGKITNPKSAEKLYVKCNGKRKVFKPKGGRLAVRVGNLEKGRNRVRLILYSQQGTSKDSKTVRIDRVVPSPPAVKNALARSVLNQ